MSDTSTCRGCGEPIRWVLTVDGARAAQPGVRSGGQRRPGDPAGRQASRPGTHRGRSCPRRSRRGCRITAPAPGGEYRRRKSLSRHQAMPACGNVLIQSLVDAGEVFHEGRHPPADLRAQVEARPDSGGRAQEGVPPPLPSSTSSRLARPCPGRAGEA